MVTMDLHTPHSRVSFRMILSNLERLSEIFNDMKHRAVSLRQLSFLFTLAIITERHANSVLSSYVRLKHESYFQKKIAEMTLKVDQFYWRWHSSIGHISFSILKFVYVVSFLNWWQPLVTFCSFKSCTMINMCSKTVSCLSFVLKPKGCANWETGGIISLRAQMGSITESDFIIIGSSIKTYVYWLLCIFILSIAIFSTIHHLYRLRFVNHK